MKTIEEIKSIEITLAEDDVIKMDYNGCNEKEGYTLIKIPIKTFSIFQTIKKDG